MRGLTAIVSCTLLYGCTSGKIQTPGEVAGYKLTRAAQSEIGGYMQVK